MTYKNSILVIPHVGIGGGAGIYIKTFIAEAQLYSDISACGEFSKEYLGDLSLCCPLLETNKIFYPNYYGVKIWHKFYWGSKALYQASKLIYYRKRILRFLDKFEFLVATSSIQIPLLRLIIALGFRGKTVCLVQENLELSGFSGKCLLRALTKISNVISISKGWSEYGQIYGLNTVYLPNTFDNPINLANSPQFDILYVGGDSSLKGFPMVLRLFHAIASHRKIQFALLGSYSNQVLAKINKLNRDYEQIGAKIHVIGLVESVYEFMFASKLLVMPIDELHFCRPAIEAGLCGRTFIMPHFVGADEFAIDGHNCMMYQPGSVLDLMDKTLTLLDSDALRKELEKNNKNNSVSFSRESHFRETIREIFE